MKIQLSQRERRLERAIVLGMLVAWGIASLATLGYQQLVNRDPTIPSGVDLGRPQG